MSFPTKYQEPNQKELLQHFSPHKSLKKFLKICFEAWRSWMSGVCVCVCGGGVPVELGWLEPTSYHSFGG